MTAVMSSSLPHELLFGYAFDNGADGLDSESYPAAGPPLLNESDANALNHFFSNPDSAAYGFGMNIDSAHHDRDAKSYDWSALLSATSHPYPVPQHQQQQQHQHQHHGTVHAQHPATTSAPDHPSSSLFGFSTAVLGTLSPFSTAASSLATSTVTAPPPLATSDDVLGAASTLYNHISAPHHSAGPSQFDHSPADQFPHSATSTTSAPANFLGHHHHAPSVSPPRSVAQPAVVPVTHADHTDLDEASRRPVIRFGSDNDFNFNGYKPSAALQTEQEITRRLIQDMNTMGRRESAPSTRASSPAGRLSASPEVDNDGRPMKRRRTSPGAPLSTSPLSANANRLLRAGSLRRAPLSIPRAVLRTTGSLGEGSSRSLAKPPKENLTEEQKRNNHIMSEQKRRNCIKQGYDTLHSLVPELRTGGYSKSQALVEAANFLETLKQGNSELRALLADAGVSTA